MKYALEMVNLEIFLTAGSNDVRETTSDSGDNPKDLISLPSLAQLCLIQ